MRRALSVICLSVFLFVAVPAEAQLRDGEVTRNAPVKLFDGGEAALTLNKLFSPAHFRMSHSYEFSSGSFGGAGGSMGMYTNTMMWQFNQKLAARVDVSYAHSPFGGSQFSNGSAAGPFGNGQLFLRNAEIAYRPSETFQFHFSVRQSPYGRYMSPYGYGNYFGQRDLYRSSGLFWNEDLR